MGLDGLKNLLAELVLVQRVTKGKDSGLIEDQVTYKVNAGNATLGRHLIQGLFNWRMSEGISPVHQVDPQHGGQWIRVSATLLAGLGVMGINQIEKDPAKAPPPPPQRGTTPVW